MFKRPRHSEMDGILASGQPDGNYFDSKRRGKDRNINAEPIYNIDQKPTSSLIIVDNTKRASGEQYNWRQNVGAVLNGGRLELQRLYVNHQWSTITTHSSVVTFIGSGAFAATGTFTIPPGFYSVASLIVALNTGVGVAGTFTLVTPNYGEDHIAITVAAGSTFAFGECPFIKFAPHVHGLSRYRTSVEVGIPGAGGWFEQPLITGPVTAQFFSPARLVPSLFYTIRSQNLTKTQKIHAHGAGVGEDTIAVFNVIPSDLGTTEMILYDVEHSVNLDVNNNVGQGVDIQIIDESGHIAESVDPTAAIILQFSVSLHY